MLLACCILLLVTCLAMGLLLFRAVKRLLQFDSLFQSIAETLESYSTDLTRMTSADLDSVLTDHPEVMSFHTRNMRARLEVQQHLEQVTRVVPKRDRSMPMPDVE